MSDMERLKESLEKLDKSWREASRIALLPILWAKQSKWSQKTFGRDSERGPIGALKHLECEAREAQAEPGDLEEYADCLLLLLDATRRACFSLGQLILCAWIKQRKNELRTWPEPTGADEPTFHCK